MDVAFDEVLNELQDLMDDSCTEDGECYMFNDDIVRMFNGIGGLFSLIKELKKAHEALGIYQLTDYHWLLLDKIISNAIDYHNDGVFSTRPPKNKLRASDIFEDFFWDNDYCLPVETVNNATEDQKAQFGLSP